MTRHLRKAGDELMYFGPDSTFETPKTPFEMHGREELLASHVKAWEERLPSEVKGPVWVANIPREFHDYEDPESHGWDNCDLFVPVYGEILSDARREWEYDRVLAKMERDGVRMENCSLLLKLAKDGRPGTSEGAGIGVEGLVCWI